LSQSSVDVLIKIDKSFAVKTFHYAYKRLNSRHLDFKTDEIRNFDLFSIHKAVLFEAASDWKSTLNMLSAYR